MSQKVATQPTKNYKSLQTTTSPAHINCICFPPYLSWNDVSPTPNTYFGRQSRAERSQGGPFKVTHLPLHFFSFLPTNKNYKSWQTTTSPVHISCIFFPPYLSLLLVGTVDPWMTQRHIQNRVPQKTESESAIFAWHFPRHIFDVVNRSEWLSTTWLRA